MRHAIKFALATGLVAAMMQALRVRWRAPRPSQPNAKRDIHVPPPPAVSPYGH